ncbi:MAG: nicotinate-nucleotide--dimethylbenzimidazole phosphoribosyltransferase [Desulfobacteraceae bacterium]|nr:nicotinate-nucleotide--dimethylbenzimidazole phosphoribosyltransferase [Desulfobacteraceae bacterium]
MNRPEFIEEIIEGIKPVNQAWMEKARKRTAQLVMPYRALGRLHDIAEKICAIQRTLEPVVDIKGVLVMAADHGVATEGISVFPQEVTASMVTTFLANGAGINAMARHVDAQVWVVDMGIIPDLDINSIKGGRRLKVKKVGNGTASFTGGPAMDRSQAKKAILTGFNLAGSLFEDGIQAVCTGDMGIGNTTSSSAIGMAITGADADEMVGAGTGLDNSGLQHKKEVILKGLKVNEPEPADGLDVLSKLGGFEIGGIAGVVLAGAYYSRPVIIDGFISTAGALIAHTLCPAVTDYLFAGHQSEEPGHKQMLKHLDLKPILDLGMRLGEGTGAALAASVMQAAVKVFNDVMTFDEAGVVKG